MSTNDGYKLLDKRRARLLNEIDRKLEEHEQKRDAATRMGDDAWDAWKAEDKRLFNEWWKAFYRGNGIGPKDEI